MESVRKLLYLEGITLEPLQLYFTWVACEITFMLYLEGYGLFLSHGKCSKLPVQIYRDLSYILCTIGTGCLT